MTTRDCVIERIENYSIDLHPDTRAAVFARYSPTGSSNINTLPNYKLVDLLCDVMIAYGQR